MSKILAIDIDKCTGCIQCELACSFKHHDEFNPSKSRIHVTSFWKQAISIPVVCRQCEEPWCARACPSGAITVTKDDSGGTLVTVSKSKCLGCRMCMLSCPFGNIIVSEKGCAEKCDLCGGDPECVKFCHTGALSFAPAGQLMTSKQEEIAGKVLSQYMEVE